MIKVLRKVKNVRLFNENDGEWLCEHINKNLFKVKEKLFEPLKSIPIRLGFALIKQTSRDFLFEKAVELGVTDFYPLVTDFSNVRDFNVKRYQIKAKESIEQSERFQIPLINDPMSLNEFLETFSNSLVAVERNVANKNLSDVISIEDCNLVIGPEGGFSDLEKNIINKKAISVSFGNWILRSETATIYGLSIINEFIRKSSL